MARMTAQQMMGGFPTRMSTGAPMPEQPTGRTGPLPPGSGKHDFVTDMDGDMDGDVRATATSVAVDMKK